MDPMKVDGLVLGCFWEIPFFYGERDRSNAIKRKQIMEDFCGRYSDHWQIDPPA